MNNIIVLGAGMVGSAMAIDLSKQHNVTLTDLNQNVLDKVKQKCPVLSIEQLDVTNKVNLGKAIIKHQAIGFKLADMATDYEAAKMLVYRAA